MRIGYMIRQAQRLEATHPGLSERIWNAITHDDDAEPSETDPNELENIESILIEHLPDYHIIR